MTSGRPINTRESDDVSQRDVAEQRDGSGDHERHDGDEEDPVVLLVQVIHGVDEAHTRRPTGQNLREEPPQQPCEREWRVRIRARIL